MTISRRQFLGTTIGVAALAACGGDDGGGADAPKAGRNCQTNGTTATISSNHGHVITVTANDVAAGADKSYDIMGTSGHTHTVMITGAQFQSLQSNANGSIMVTSSSNAGHTHDIVVLCA